MRFSVIIPVYRVEEYLEQCISSIACQNYNSFEIILVNDGSPDKSPQICDQFANIYNNIFVIHKKNGGSSSARNAGILAAKGEYLIFIDSDDYWDSTEALSKISNAINNEQDVLIFGCKDLDCLVNSIEISRGGYDSDYINNLPYEHKIKYLINRNIFPGSAWITVSKRSLILENKIFFKEGIKAEDIDWLVHLFKKSTTLSILDESFYIYRKNRAGSITTTSNFKSGQDIMYSISKWANLLSEKNILDRSLFSFLAYHYTIALMIFGNNINSVNSNLIEQLQANKFLLKFGTRLSTKAIFHLSKVLSINNLMLLIKYIYKIR